MFRNVKPDSPIFPNLPNLIINMSQSAYAMNLLDRAGLKDCNPTSTPMEAWLQPSKASSEVLVDATEYRSVVGALHYLVHTKPDLAHAVSFVNRFLAEPHEDHKAVVKCILRYIAGTADNGIWYERGAGELLLLGFSDSDHAGDIDDNRSTSGILFYLGKNPITWESQKQK
jgi:hypothetical protein